MADKSHLSVWAFVVATFRIILFIICILDLFSGIIVLWLLTLLDLYFDYSIVPNLQMAYVYISHVQLICLVIVASVGVYGAYSGNPKYLKLFSLLIFIYAALFFLVSTTHLAASTDQGNAEAKFLQRLEDYAKDYQFDLLPNEEPNKATEFWDRLQTYYGCCGVHGRHDWKGVKSNLTSESHRLPKSCCAKLATSVLGVCTTNSPDIHEDGCGQALEDFSSISNPSLWNIIQELLFNLVLAAIALVVANHREPPHNVVRRPSKCHDLDASTV